MYSSNCGLGFVDPATAATVAPAVAQAFSKAWSAIEGIFGIGSGRKEADLIVPVQNQVGARMDEIKRDIPRASMAALQGYYNELESMLAEFRRFVYDPVFTSDGDQRASDGAIATIEPQINDLLDDIEYRIYAAGGTISPPSLTQGYGSAVPTLRYQLPEYPYLPQGGSLPPVSPVSTVRQQSILPVSASVQDFLPVALAGGALFLLLRRRR